MGFNTQPFPDVHRTPQLYASISDYEFDIFDAAEFSGDSFADVYGENMRIINKIKSSSLKKYHALMHRLFREIRWVSRLSSSHSRLYVSCTNDIII